MKNFFKGKLILFFVLVAIAVNLSGCTIYDYTVNSSKYATLIQFGLDFDAQFGKVMNEWRTDLNSLGTHKLVQESVERMVQQFVEGNQKDASDKLYSTYTATEIANWLNDVRTDYASLGLQSVHNFKIFEDSTVGELNRSTVAHLIINLRELQRIQKDIFYAYLKSADDATFDAALTTEQKAYFDITKDRVGNVLGDQVYEKNATYTITLTRAALIAELGRRALTPSNVNSMFDMGNYTINQAVLDVLVNDEMLAIIYPNKTALERAEIYTSVRDQFVELGSDVPSTIKTRARLELPIIEYALPIIRHGGGGGSSTPTTSATVTPTATPTPTAGEPTLPPTQPNIKFKDKVWDIKYINGYPGDVVRPDGDTSRAEVVAMFYRILDIAKQTNSDLKFTDLAEAMWASDQVDLFGNVKIVDGYGDGTFKPNNGVTRAEFVQMLSKILKIEQGTSDKFSDIKGHWAEQQIQNFAVLGYIKGYNDGTFRPDNKITRAEAVTIINRILNIPIKKDIQPEFNDLKPGHWAYDGFMTIVKKYGFTDRINQ